MSAGALQLRKLQARDFDVDMMVALGRWIIIGNQHARATPLSSLSGR